MTTAADSDDNYDYHDYDGRTCKDDDKYDNNDNGTDHYKITILTVIDDCDIDNDNGKNNRKDTTLTLILMIIN